MRLREGLSRKEARAEEIVNMSIPRVEWSMEWREKKSGAKMKAER